jgi:LETM1 and EF-hand domain-containing protein 1
VDLFRLIPFIAIVIIPFAELCLPFLLKFFPNMLPSTFEDKLEKEAKRKKQFQIKLEMAKFLQEALDLRSHQISGTPSAKHFAELMKKVKAGERLNTEEILSCSKLFEDDLTLENLNREKITALCRFLGITPFGTTSYLRNQITRKLDQLKEDDKLIMAEGLDSLTGSELRSACAARGIPYQNYPLAKSQLEQWLQLSLEHEVPASLLILSRVLNLTPSDAKPPVPWYEERKEPELTEALGQMISTLPEGLLQNTQLACPTTNPEDNAVKLAALKTEIGQLQKEEEEKKEKEKEKRTKEEQEKAAKKAAEAAKKAADAAAAAATEAKTKVKRAPEAPAVEAEVPGAVLPGLEKKHVLTTEELQQVTEAVSAMAASSSPLVKQRQELAELKEMLEHQKQVLKEAAAAAGVSGAAAEAVGAAPAAGGAGAAPPTPSEKKKAAPPEIDKVASRLETRLETIVKQLDKELEDVDKNTKQFFAIVDQNKDGYISFDEFKFALEQLKKKYSPEEVKDMFSLLDLNSDGQISIADLHQLLLEKEKVDDLRAKRAIDSVKRLTHHILSSRQSPPTTTTTTTTTATPAASVVEEKAT